MHKKHEEGAHDLVYIFGTYCSPQLPCQTPEHSAVREDVWGWRGAKLNLDERSVSVNAATPSCISALPHQLSPRRSLSSGYSFPICQGQPFFLALVLLPMHCDQLCTDKFNRITTGTTQRHCSSNTWNDAQWSETPKMLAKSRKRFGYD